MVKFGPAESPEAWAWVKTWTHIRDDSRCWEAMDKMRRAFIEPEDWSALPAYLAKIKRGLRERRWDAQDYAVPLNEEIDGADDPTLQALLS